MRISDWSSDVCSSDLSADLPCRKDAQRQKHKEDDGCEDEQDLGDSCGRARNAAEPQKSGNHCDNGENQCPFQHRKFILTPGGTRKRIAMFQPNASPPISRPTAESRSNRKTNVRAACPRAPSSTPSHPHRPPRQSSHHHTP